MTYQDKLKDVNCDNCGIEFDANRCPDLDKFLGVFYYTCPECKWRNQYNEEIDE